MPSDIENWLDSVTGSEWIWYAKRLSANDSGETGSHQVGIYIPKPAFWTIFPLLQSGVNPDASFHVDIMPHGQPRDLRAIWYNDKTRNETRITRWNLPSRVLDPDLTGGLILMAFHKPPNSNADYARIWICQNIAEESVIEDRIGVIEPGEGVIHYPLPTATAQPLVPAQTEKRCSLAENEIPPEWLQRFPSPQELIARALQMTPVDADTPDSRLIQRRECETSLFYSVERATVLPIVQGGFASVEAFIDCANSVTNRRKSRAGQSLELHLKTIFDEEQLPCAHGAVSEGNKKPDFLFPSQTSYQNPAWPAGKLRMLGAKTTCKDRWRQILNEADRIPQKHLFTLQEGVSENQFQEMRTAGVILVIPESLRSRYPKPIRPELICLETFIGQTREITG